MSEIWALIDANNFFVSCERVFRPDLRDKPVIVLSCNDGCAVSRSQEVKDLGIPMGVPRFQIEDKIKKYDIQCFSSNFRLYGDLSSRVMRTIREVVGGENQEVYSIDECFVRGTHLGVKDWGEWARKLRTKILQEIGIPVTVGVAPSKTLAKLAVEIAKSDVFGNGTMVWRSEDENWREQYLQMAPIANVWGIGRASARKLLARKVDTVSKFLQLEAADVRKMLGVVGLKTWQELKGVSCIELTEVKTANQSILRSRSFGEAVYAKEELEHALATYLSIASENLRRHGLRAAAVTTFIATSRFLDLPKRYANSVTVGLAESTSYLPDLATAMRKGLNQIYVKGYAYKKAGVILSGLEKETAWQPQLLTSEEAPIAEEKKQAVMRAIEKLNLGYGQRKVGIGLTSESEKSEGRQVQAKWKSRATSRSPEYSTSWLDLRIVR